MSYFGSKDSDFSNALKDLLSWVESEDKETINYLEYFESSLQTFLHFLKNLIIWYCKDLTQRQLNYLPSWMSSLLSKLKNRLVKRFFCSLIRISKSYANEDVWKEAVSDFRVFYANATSYLENHFDFSNQNSLKSIFSLSLTRAITFEELINAVISLEISKTFI